MKYETMEMAAQTVSAHNKTEALALIESQTAAVVELDYEDGLHDFTELGRLGRKWRVAVLFRAQELIAVESMQALLRGLEPAKNTFRQRILVCTFDLRGCAAEDLKQAESRAALIGDFIIPHVALSKPYEVWID